MKILVTFALGNEFAPWPAMHDYRAERWGATEAYFAEVGGAELGVVLTGVGSKQAWVAALKVMWGGYDSIGCCISSGLAGALRPAYQIGQIVAARAVCSERWYADLASQTLESNNLLVNLAAEHGAVPVDRFYTATQVVTSAEEKKELGAQADAVEMESFDILRECQNLGVPAVAIRAISDGVDEDLPLDFDRVIDRDGRVSTTRVLGEMVRRPQLVPGLIRLGQQSKRAADSLAQFLDRYVVSVAAQAEIVSAKVTAATR
jgi:adenosylhomocysteine nucleosidase